MINKKGKVFAHSIYFILQLKVDEKCICSDKIVCALFYMHILLFIQVIHIIGLPVMESFVFSSMGSIVYWLA